MPITIIAEAGSSPAAGDFDFGRWARAARDAGATAIKMQMFYAYHFPKGEQASKRALEFPRERLGDFVAAAHACGMQAGVSVFDTPGAAQAGAACDFVKLAAREAANKPLIMVAWSNAVEYQRPLYRSIAALDELYHLPNIVHFWTVPRYPAPLGLSCLRALQAARYFNAVNMAWGWSSHTTGIFDVLLAAKVGAKVFEKHLAITPDDVEAGHSLTVDQFAAMCRAIRKNERN